LATLHPQFMVSTLLKQAHIIHRAGETVLSATPRGRGRLDEQQTRRFLLSERGRQQQGALQ
jgi:hypothetical protein